MIAVNINLIVCGTYVESAASYSTIEQTLANYHAIMLMLAQTTTHDLRFYARTLKTKIEMTQGGCEYRVFLNLVYPSEPAQL